MKLSSPDFNNKDYIPKKCSFHGGNTSPELDIDDVPDGTKTFALIMDDPDAPMGTWVHWIVWNIPIVRRIEEGKLPEGSVVGRNSWGRNEYGGPAPPSGTHRYFFKLYALDTSLSLPESSDKNDLEKAMKGHVIGKAELIGLYRAD